MSHPDAGMSRKHSTRTIRRRVTLTVKRVRTRTGNVQLYIVSRR